MPVNKLLSLAVSKYLSQVFDEILHTAFVFMMVLSVEINSFYITHPLLKTIMLEIKLDGFSVPVAPVSPLAPFVPCHPMSPGLPVAPVAPSIPVDPMAPGIPFNPTKSETKT